MASVRSTGPGSRGSLAALEHVRKICLAMPDATERTSHGMQSWFIGKAPSFATFADHHHGDGRCALWFAAPPGAQEALVGADPERFFLPPYVAYRGWCGVLLDRGVPWPEIRSLVEDAYDAVARKKR